jgi:hypothetical protein
MEFKGDVIRLLPLDLKWLTKAIEEKKLQLSYVNDEKDSWRLFTCSAGDWMKFLAKYGNDKDAFPDDAEFVLKKSDGK